MSGADTVGSLLAAIATSLSEALRTMTFADKRQWGPDEHEQVRALEDALDGAKRDFQEMSPLVNGQFYYENDRRPETINELRTLAVKFETHSQTFKDWVRTGGPINPIWARDTSTLKGLLHRAQCRAARRIFAAEKDGNRCLGAFQVYRQQRRNTSERAQKRAARSELPPWQQQSEHAADLEAARQRGDDVDPQRRTSMEELVPICNAIGRFERFGEHDIAFVCDYCDGFIVWEDLDRMPSARTPLVEGATAQPNWQAGGNSVTTGEEKTIVFAPIAIANHLPPESRDWQARISCPYCDNYTYFDQGHDSEDEVKWEQEEGGFPDLQSFQEHLEWNHTSLPVPAIPALPSSSSKCTIM